MANPDDDSTDGTPIKPVSSLRSHFESIGSISPATHGTSSRASPRPDADCGQVRKEQGFLERASLDIPRRPSPWAESKDTSHLESAKVMGPPVTPRNQRPRSAMFHRPSCARPTTPHLAPPLVTIVSPKSPPQSAHLPHNSSLPDLPSPRSSTTSGLGSRPAPPIPPHSLHPDTQMQTHPPDPDVHQEKQALVESPIPMRKINAASTINTALANIPPPVNRADKPKITLKPSKSRVKSTLEPEVVVNAERVSPFSTPPSSDDRPVQPFRMNDSNMSNEQLINPKHRISPFSPPSAHGPVRRWRKANGNFAHLESMKAESDVARTGDTFQSVQEARPGLPPRRMTEKSPGQPQATRSQDARYASSGNISRQSSQVEGTISIVPLRIPREVPAPSGFLPPPKRTGTGDSVDAWKTQRQNPSPMPDLTYDTNLAADYKSELPTGGAHAAEYPDASQTNRRPPNTKQGIHEIDTNYDTRLFEFCGDHLCTTGYHTKAWDLTSGSVIMNLGHGEQTKVTALGFKPGATAEEEGLRLWMGTNFGDLYEVDIPTQSVISTKTSAHSRREVVKIHRHQNSMWTLDEGGSLYVWSPDRSGLPNIQGNPVSRRVPKGHTFSLVIDRKLWLATGKEIRVFSPESPDADFTLTLQPLAQHNVGEVTSGAVISTQQDRVYFGHADGKVTIYSVNDFSCLGVVNVSVYKINTLAGAGGYLWAGYNTGMIYVYDTCTQPWRTKKDWQAHSLPVASILVDRSSVWKTGVLQVASIGMDNAVRVWDGLLEEDWLENDMQEHDTEYCNFRELRAVVVTWNAGAATPSNLRYEERDSNFFREVLDVENPPEILVFGFQELVDLEDKKLTAKSLFKSNKKKDTEHEHMSRQYRAWRDHLVMSIENNMPSNEPYHLLHTASMVGLFSCVFVKASIRSRIGNLNAAEVKRGMGGLHGNKGCIVLRFLVDDSSLCLVNCHLAAGQTQTLHRNNDISAILESILLPPERNPNTRCDSYCGGGDGSMILDHEICILNGDLNYRIDTMSRDTVVKAVQAQNFKKLLERDQLLVSRRRNPGFRLRAFTESPITFAPTYKYDVGTDRYDTSEKHRAPAWCDRILYRGGGRIKQLDYRRHELKVSDHRPVSATFKLRIKSVSQEKRPAAWQACLKRFETAKAEMARNVKIIYLRDVLGVDLEEARSLV